jgi:multicomponent Na+:H+ antiporter subunit G
MITTNPGDMVTAILLIIGTFFMFVGALGLLRMPDLFMRMSATTKSVTMGVSFMLIAVAVHFNELGLGTRALATIAFVFITAPIAAHMIGRAGYARQVELWEGTIADELRGRYDPETGELISRPPVPAETAASEGTD